MNETPQHDEEIVVKKDNPEADKDEGAKNPEKKDAKPERTPEEEQKAQQERVEKKERQETRNKEEKKEQTQDVQSAEKMLEDEQMKETYKEMTDGLRGDASEVFKAIEPQLTEQDRIGLAKTFVGFEKVSSEEWSKGHPDLRGKSPEEVRRDVSVTIVKTFQNSIDDLMRKAQNQEEERPKTNAGRLGVELNERANEVFRKTISPDAASAWFKTCDAVKAHVKAETAKNPNRPFKGQPKPEERDESYGKSERMLKLAADAYGAENVLREMGKAKEMGIETQILDQDGKEVTDLKTIAEMPSITLNIKSSGSLTPAQVEKAMTPGNLFLKGDGAGQQFAGGFIQIREGLEKLQTNVVENKKKSEAPKK